MSDTLRLLKFSPSVALLIMANNHHNLHLRTEYAKVGPPVAITEDITEVVIESFDSKNDFIPTPYSGSFTFRYRRLNVAEVMGELRLNLTPPLTVGGILASIAQQTGCVIDEDDFENALIETDTFDLVAKPTSLRWVGQTTVVLNKPDEVLSLADAFPNNILNGLTGPDFGTDTPLSLIVLKTRLNGLYYPWGDNTLLDQVITDTLLPGLYYPDEEPPLGDFVDTQILNGLFLPE